MLIAGFQRNRLSSVVMAASGNFAEMFDFMVYGYYASAIARAYFPAHDEYASLMASLATFGAGFLMRPIGAVVLGTLMDRIGRRSGLLLTLGLMGLGTLAVAITPTYARIGVAAPLVVFLGRLLQGFSAGVEVGGVSVYLAEQAPPHRRGLYVSWQSASQQVAVVAAALIGVIGSLCLTPIQMERWGWRIPFLLGCALLPFLMLLRKGLPESAVFARTAQRPATRDLLETLWRNFPVVVGGAAMALPTTVMFYMITAYAPIFSSGVLHMSQRVSYGVAMCVGLSNFVLLPLMGLLSDRFGRRPQLIIAAGAACVVSFPLLAWLVSAPSLTRLLTTELSLSVIYAMYNGAMVVHLTEVIPPKIRATGFSLAYSLATAVFGGFTPAVCTYLIHATGNRAMPGVWVSFAAAVGLAAVLAIRSRAGAASDAPNAFGAPSLEGHGDDDVQSIASV